MHEAVQQWMGLIGDGATVRHAEGTACAGRANADEEGMHGDMNAFVDETHDFTAGIGSSRRIRAVVRRKMERKRLVVNASNRLELVKMGDLDLCYCDKQAQSGPSDRGEGRGKTGKRRFAAHRLGMLSHRQIDDMSVADVGEGFGHEDGGYDTSVKDHGPAPSAGYGDDRHHQRKVRVKCTCRAQKASVGDETSSLEALMLRTAGVAQGRGVGQASKRWNRVGSGKHHGNGGGTPCYPGPSIEKERIKWATIAERTKCSDRYGLGFSRTRIWSDAGASLVEAHRSNPAYGGSQSGGLLETLGDRYDTSVAVASSSDLSDDESAPVGGASNMSKRRADARERGPRAFGTSHDTVLIREVVSRGVGGSGFSTVMGSRGDDPFVLCDANERHPLKQDIWASTDVYAACEQLQGEFERGALGPATTGERGVGVPPLSEDDTDAFLSFLDLCGYMADDDSRGAIASSMLKSEAVVTAKPRVGSGSSGVASLASAPERHPPESHEQTGMMTMLSVLATLKSKKRIPQALDHTMRDLAPLDGEAVAPGQWLAGPEWRHWRRGAHAILHAVNVVACLLYKALNSRDNHHGSSSDDVSGEAAFVDKYVARVRSPAALRPALVALADFLECLGKIPAGSLQLPLPMISARVLIDEPNVGNSIRSLLKGAWIHPVHHLATGYAEWHAPDKAVVVGLCFILLCAIRRLDETAEESTVTPTAASLLRLVGGTDSFVSEGAVPSPKMPVTSGKLLSPPVVQQHASVRMERTPFECPGVLRTLLSLGKK